MKIISPEQSLSQEWGRVVGASHDVLIARILSGNWLSGFALDEVVAAGELGGVPFGLAFTYFASSAAALNMVQRVGHKLWHIDARARESISLAQFDVIFNYQDNPRDVRLHNVNFLGMTYKYKGLGKQLLANTVRVALDLDCNRIFVEPGADGSWYWTSRGALIQEWPQQEGFVNSPDLRIGRIIHPKSDMAAHWDRDDVKELKRIHDTRDCFALNQIVARDDLWVKSGNEEMPLRRFLLQHAVMGPCIFDLDHPWTQKCLLQRTGIDVVEERALRAKSEVRLSRKFGLPEYSPGIKAFAPAF